MRGTVRKLRTGPLALPSRSGHAITAEVVGHESGYLDVRLADGEVVRAQYLAHLAANPSDLIGSRVMAVFDGAAPERPVVIGVIAGSETPQMRQTTLAGRPRSATLDGKRVVLDASEEIVLQCGKGAITLTADGRIVIKGTDIVSRALRTHKIKGGAVNIN